jgi:type IV pilus assembly protein PilZ
MDYGSRTLQKIMSDTSPNYPRQGIFSLTIQDKNSLYDAYMPFIKNGGLFIPTTRSHELGDEVYMLLTLLDSPDKLPVTGRVVWITPVGAHGNRTPGVGIQFSELDKGATRSRIETLLAEALKPARHTQTM